LTSNVLHNARNDDTSRLIHTCGKIANERVDATVGEHENHGEVVEPAKYTYK